MQQLKYTSVHDVPHTLCDELEQASFGADGLLYKSFRQIKFEGDPYDGTVVVFVQHKRVIGWGILLNYSEFSSEADYTLMLFVHDSYRKRGIGRRIATELLNHAEGNVFAWPSIDSGGQQGFFQRLNNPKITLWGRVRTATN